MSILNVEHLSISYRVGKNWLPAVRDFSLQIQPGEIHGIVGESGSGKSTVAAALMGFLPPNGRILNGSRIQFMGDDLVGRPMRELWTSRIKLVPQNPAAALNPSMKVGEQVAESVRYALGLDRKAAYDATIEMFRRVQMVDPEKVAGRYPHELSGGMQQRVMIALALITDPELLILDEPTTGLDVTTEAVILDLIRELIVGRKAGVIYITHNLGVVAQLCHAVTIMYAGEIMVDGVVKDIFAKPLHPYTIGLLNSLPRPGWTKRDAALQSIEGDLPSLQNLPTGCVFAPRCAFAIEKCHATKPALEYTPAGRRVRCHRWEEIEGGISPSPQTPLLRGERGFIPAQETSTPVLNDEGKFSENPNLLKVENLTAHFAAPRRLRDLARGITPPPIQAVDGVNLSIQQGHTLGLVGESGSGKTTLARLIVGLQERTAGEIKLFGADVRGSARERGRDVLAKMQMVFQNPQNALNPYLSVGQTIRRPLIKLAGMNRKQADAEVLRLLRAVNLREEYARRYPDELSGGEKQRVVIARAFASNPDLVVCDEPISALDVSVQAAVLNLLARLQDENGVAYLFISHDLAVVGYLADYVAVMYLGQLFEVGYARDMFDPPLHPYTESLISAIPVPDPSQQTERVRLKGEIPSTQYVPGGCRFHTRCPHKLGAICEQEVPPWRDDGDAHFVRCHIPLEELKALQAWLTTPLKEEG